MKKKTKKRLLSLLIAIVVLLLGITANSAMEPPLVPAMTWDALLGHSGLEHPVEMPKGELQVHFIDVGNADATLFLTGDKAMLIDAGEKGDGDLVVDYLQQKGVDKLDYVIATHPDADHIGGMADVLEQVPVDNLLLTFMEEEHTPTSFTYERFLTAIDEQNIPIIEAAPGQQYKLGEAVIDILGPVGTYEETNNMSVVSRVTFGNRRFLMMGDAEKEAETAIINSGVDLSADVLKAGHHGSRSSTTKKFLKLVSPTHAFLPCGADNRYGHPHPETLDALQQQKVTVWRADRDGTVVMTTNGENLTVRKKDAA